MSEIRLRGLRAGNLQRLDLDLPQSQWTAVHGPSGAGKSALLFRTLEPIARQRFRILEDPAALPGTEEDWLPHVADRVEGLQPVLAAAGEIPRGRRLVEVGTALDLFRALQRVFVAHGARRCPQCAHEWRELEAADLVAQAEAADEGARVLLFVECGGASTASLLQAGWTRVRLGDAGLARLEEAPETLPADAWLLLDRVKWRDDHRARLEEAAREALRRRRAILLEIDGQAHASAAPDRCPQCAHALREQPVDRLAEERELEDRIVHGVSWAAWLRRPLHEWRTLPDELGARTHRRLEYLECTRLGHLTALRTLGTLSLGEGRRLELVALLAQVRCGQLALFDEPGMGLHGSERRALAGLLRELVEQGNTVLTADPAREFLEAADHWLLLGPGGGPEGGQIVGQGPRADLPAPEDEQRGAAPSVRPVREASGTLQFTSLTTRFLDIPQLSMPMGSLVAVVGVSGSGKSTLFEEELVPRLREERDFEGALPLGGVRVLLERALGSSAFSTVATLSGAWGEIRRAFAEGEEARVRGLHASDLVARRGQGGCDRCGGHGVDARRWPCPVCEGLGLRDDLLDLGLRNRALREWLTTPLERLEKRLPADGRLRALVRHLTALGLGQRTFGERGRHLSLGERGRIALARALASTRRDRPQLFLLDEPCLGLPFREARKVVDLLHALCDEGHSFWVAEHHEVLLRAADHVVELGPAAGPEGGQLLFAGRPQELPEADTPTGQWLRSRAESLELPPAPAEGRALTSEAIPDDLTRAGRARLEDALQRELATRSPLLADDVGGGRLGAGVAPLAEQEATQSLAPTAWPSAAPGDARIGEVLGLTPTMRRLVRTLGGPACANCGGIGPWPDLGTAFADCADDAPPAGALTFTARPQLPDGAHGAEARFLLAAGFRRRWRAGARENLRATDAWEAQDALWLDHFDAREEGRTGRVQDLEHQLQVLGATALEAHQDGQMLWSYCPGACRRCGEVEAGWRHQLAGRDLESLLQAPLEECLEHFDAHAPHPLFARARELLLGTPAWRAAAGDRFTSLDPLARRVLRSLGFLIAPVEGVRILHDQPLAALPASLARRWATAFGDGDHGAHLWTDPEGFADADWTPESPDLATLGIRPAPFPLGYDLDQGDPPRAAGEDRLRDALGLTTPLREHYLRTEEARLRGWTGRDLGRGPQGRRCERCLGRGGQAVHPSLTLLCPLCQGSGWSRETGALEDRGLRWPDLGASSLSALAEHFAASPRLASVLDLAVRSGLGGLRLDERMDRLPLGLRAWAPILAALAADQGEAGELWIAPAAGWNRLDLPGMASTIEDFASRLTAPIWRENHPDWVPSGEC